MDSDSIENLEFIVNSPSHNELKDLLEQKKQIYYQESQNQRNSEILKRKQQLRQSLLDKIAAGGASIHKKMFQVKKNDQDFFHQYPHQPTPFKAFKLVDDYKKGSITNKNSMSATPKNYWKIPNRTSNIFNPIQYGIENQPITQNNTRNSLSNNMSRTAAFNTTFTTNGYQYRNSFSGGRQIRAQTRHSENRWKLDSGISKRNIPFKSPEYDLLNIQITPNQKIISSPAFKTTCKYGNFFEKPNFGSEKPADEVTKLKRFIKKNKDFNIKLNF